MFNRDSADRAGSTEGAGTRPADRARMVASASVALENHYCDSCRAGRLCDLAMLAQDVLALDQLLAAREESSAVAAQIEQAHQDGRMEAVAQALAVIGRAEGELRAEADGDAHHPAFLMAETLRHLGLTIRLEIRDPDSPTTLEVLARAEEARELAKYVREVSEQYRTSQKDVAEALDNVAGDIAKGTEGVNRLLEASNINTPVDKLRELAFDPDSDVRWWAAQNPSTPTETLIEVVSAERHPTVLAALLVNPNLPDRLVEVFVDYSNPDVAGVARRRLGAATV
ncbi:hypothetical protein RN607_06400 [Demequina capsici]|uniref:Leucine rich repeat variant n=1 Tax=Demequina capsici TaxID=3075620 RepID=A0AA96J7Z7_9MICO|nr:MULTISPECIES: hypothetical protein [unclassified Demequina]WNM25737.1 hypothetical protein RN606_06195 [Demequina sp. OYTSA14]WNM28632.1 hypothetical protein RN607_06400 [Demequina sp. PMTSA13]